MNNSYHCVFPFRGIVFENNLKLKCSRTVNDCFKLIKQVFITYIMLSVMKFKPSTFTRIEATENL